MGRRICIGKGFGELVVQIVLLHFVRHFEMEKDENYVEKKVIRASYGFRNPTVVITQKIAH